MFTNTSGIPIPDKWSNMAYLKQVFRLDKFLGADKSIQEEHNFFEVYKWLTQHL